MENIPQSWEANFYKLGGIKKLVKGTIPTHNSKLLGRKREG